MAVFSLFNVKADKLGEQKTYKVLKDLRPVGFSDNGYLWCLFMTSVQFLVNEKEGKLNWKPFYLNMMGFAL